MSLYLVQHGKSLPKDRDPEKGLSEEGQSEVEMIAAVARGYGVPVSTVAHSGKSVPAKPLKSSQPHLTQKTE